MGSVTLVDFGQGRGLASSDRGGLDSEVLADTHARIRIALRRMRLPSGNSVPMAASRIIRTRVLTPYMELASPVERIPNFDLLFESLSQGNWQTVGAQHYPIGARLAITNSLTQRLFQVFGHPGADQEKWEKHNAFEVISETLVMLLVAPCDTNRLAYAH